jgi:hypothetical protein
MTFTGVTETLDNGQILKQYSYPPPPGSSQSGNVYINIIFNAEGNPVSATVVNPTSTPATTTHGTSTAKPTTKGSTKPTG